MDTVEPAAILKYVGRFQQELHRLHVAVGKQDPRSIESNGETMQVVEILADNPAGFGEAAMSANYELCYWHALMLEDTADITHLESSGRYWARCYVLCAPDQRPPSEAIPAAISPFTAFSASAPIPEPWTRGVTTGLIEGSRYLKVEDLGVAGQALRRSETREREPGYYELLSRCRSLAVQASDSDLLRLIVEKSRLAISRIDILSPEDAEAYQNLHANALTDLYDETGEVAYLNEALDEYRSLLQHPDWSNRRSHQVLSNYLRALKTSAAHLASLDAFRKAMEIIQTRSQDSQDNALESHIAAMKSSLLLREREFTQNPASLDEAVAEARRAVKLSENQGELIQETAYSSLADAMGERARVWEDPDDIATMVWANEKRVEMSHDAPHSRAHSLCNLVLSRLAARDLGAPFLWPQTREELEESLELETSTCPERGYTYSAAAHAYLAAFEQLGERPLLEKAEYWANAGLSCTDEQDSQFGRRNADVAAVLAARFKSFGDSASARMSIDHYTSASQYFPDARERAIYRGEAAEVASRLCLSGGIEPTVAQPLLIAVAEDRDAPGSTRFRAATALAQIANMATRPQEVLAALDLAVQCLGDVPYAALRRGDRMEQLSRRTWVVAEAASLALSLGDVPKALSIIETGRERLHGEQRELRRTANEATNSGRDDVPLLARRVLALQDELDEARRGPVPPEEIDAIQGNLRAAHTSWKRACAQQSVANAAGGEPIAPDDETIVIIVPGTESGYAMSAADQCVVPLPDLTARACLAKAGAFHDAFGRFLHRSDDAHVQGLLEDVRVKCLDLLSFSWDAAVEPILAALRTSNSEPWNVVWLPIGPASVVPFHAAGRYDGIGAGLNALDRIVSSYTPSLWTYSRRGKGTRDLAASEWRVLAAAGDPGTSDYLTAVAGECEQVGRALLLPAGSVKTSASGDDLIAALQEATAVHVAGHGTSHMPRIGPSLVMADREVSIGELAQLDHISTRWACLSACHSAGGEVGLLDEGGSTALQLVEMGCVDVIAAQWQVNDEVAAEFAEELYTSLQKHCWQSENTAVALNEVCRSLLSRYREYPFVWAGYVHIRSGHHDGRRI